jgi:hypothetical protein
MSKKSPLTLKRGLALGIAASTLFLAGCAQMSGPGMGALAGGGGSSQAADAGKIVGAISVSLVSLSEALAQYNRALGNDALAIKLEAEAKSLRDGVRPDNAIKVISSATEETDELIRKKTAENVQLDDKSKEQFTKGLALHAVGTVAAVKAGKDLGDALKSRSPATLSALAGVAGFPPVIAIWAKATDSVVKYSQQQKMDASGVSKALADS